MLPIQETRGFNDSNGKTISQRTKENSEDYRYFPKPDIPALTISKDWIDSIKDTVPELPDTKVRRLIKDYGISSEHASVISQSIPLANYFDLVCEKLDNSRYKLASNWFAV